MPMPGPLCEKCHSWNHRTSACPKGKPIDWSLTLVVFAGLAALFYGMWEVLHTLWR